MNRRFRIISAIVVLLALGVSVCVRLYAEHAYKKASEAIMAGNYSEAIKFYDSIPFFKDSEERRDEARRLEGEASENEEKYEQALDLFNRHAYSEALKLFQELGTYEESEDKANLCEMAIRRAKENAYAQALEKYENGDYFDAIIQFEVLEDYEDSTKYVERCYDRIRKKLANKFSSGSLFSVAIGEQDLFFTESCDSGQETLQGENFISVSAGGFHVVGLQADGTAKIAGDISWWIEDFHDWKNVLQVSAGYDFVAALLESGKVEIQGYNGSENYKQNQIIECEQWENIVQIDTAYHLLAGIDRSGKIFVTGKGSEQIAEEIERNPGKWKDVVYLAVGGDSVRGAFLVGLKSDGDVVTAGEDGYGIDEAQQWKNITQISAADYHLVGMDEFGNIKAVMNHFPNRDSWADQGCCNFDSWIGVKIVALEAGNGTTLGMSEDGYIYSSGYNHEGQIPANKEWKIPVD